MLSIKNRLSSSMLCLSALIMCNEQAAAKSITSTRESDILSPTRTKTLNDKIYVNLGISEELLIKRPKEKVIPETEINTFKQNVEKLNSLGIQLTDRAYSQKIYEIDLSNINNFLALSSLILKGIEANIKKSDPQEYTSKMKILGSTKLEAITQIISQIESSITSDNTHKDTQKLEELVLEIKKLIWSLRLENEKNESTLLYSSMQSVCIILTQHLLLAKKADFIEINKETLQHATGDRIDMNAQGSLFVPIEELPISAGVKLDAHSGAGKNSDGTYSSKKGGAVSGGINFSALKIQAKASAGIGLETGKKYSGSSTISESKNRALKVKNQLIYSKELTEYKKLTKIIDKNTDLIKPALSILKNNTVLLNNITGKEAVQIGSSFAKHCKLIFPLNQNKYNKENIKSFKVFSSASVGSEMLSTLDLTVTTANQINMHTNSNNFAKTIEDLNIFDFNQNNTVIGNDRMLTLLAKMCDMEEEIKNALGGDHISFSKILQKHNLGGGITELNNVTQYYSKILTALANDNVDEEIRKDLSRQKHNLENHIKVNGRKNALQALAGTFFYHLYFENNLLQYQEEYSTTKINLENIAKHLEDSSSILNNKKEFKKYTATSMDNFVSLNIGQGAIEFSCEKVTNNPDIFKNGLNFTISFNIELLLKLYKAVEKISSNETVKSLTSNQVARLLNKIIEFLKSDKASIFGKNLPVDKAVEMADSFINALTNIKNEFDALENATEFTNSFFKKAKIPFILKNDDTTKLMFQMKVTKSRGFEFLGGVLSHYNGKSLELEAEVNSAEVSLDANIGVTRFSNKNMQNPSTMFNLARSYSQYISNIDSNKRDSISVKDSEKFIDEIISPNELQQLIDAFKNDKAQKNFDKFKTDIINNAHFITKTSDKKALDLLINTDIKEQQLWLNPPMLRELLISLSHLYHVTCVIPHKQKIYKEI